MGNSLLDFVMALVRDPAVAARYAADPAGVLADAHLSGVTISDVNNLIPVVTDSLAAATPGFGTTHDAGNVWASGAATAAFDAFGIHVPDGDHVDQQLFTVRLESHAADRPVEEIHLEAVPLVPESPVQQPLDPVIPDSVDDGVWQQQHVEPQIDHHPGDHSGFDLF